MRHYGSLHCSRIHQARRRDHRPGWNAQQLVGCSGGMGEDRITRGCLIIMDMLLALRSQHMTHSDNRISIIAIHRSTHQSAILLSCRPDLVWDRPCVRIQPTSCVNALSHSLATVGVLAKNRTRLVGIRTAFLGILSGCETEVY